MADTLVRGLKIPTNCAACPFRLVWCRERIYMETRPKRCPLYEVPKHGRLIDENALFHKLEETGWYKNADRDIAESLVLLAPTVIPANEVKA